MTRKITFATLSPEQLRELVIYQMAFGEEMTTTFAAMLVELGQLTRNGGSVACNDVREALNRWSVAVNEIIEAADAEGFRIVGIAPDADHAP